MSTTSLTTRRLTVVVWLAALLLGTNLTLKYTSSSLSLFGASPAARAAVEPTSPAPHTAVFREFMSAPEGERPGMRLTTALRSDGARVERVDYQLKTRAEVVRLLFMPGERLIQTDEIKGEWSQITMTKRAREPKHQCLASADGIVVDATEKVSGSSKVNGFRTLIVVGQGRRSEYAPDLSCAQLSLRLEHAGGWNERRLESIEVGEPAESLFALDGLREVPYRGR